MADDDEKEEEDDILLAIPVLFALSNGRDRVRTVEDTRVMVAMMFDDAFMCWGLEFPPDLLQLRYDGGNSYLLRKQSKFTSHCI